MSADLPLVTEAQPSHLFVGIIDSEATFSYYDRIFGIEVTRDHTFSAPALDDIYGRSGVTIRSAFFDLPGYRIHTIETMGVDHPSPTSRPGSLGINGMSFTITDAEATRSALDAAGLDPSPINTFEQTDLVSRLFFVTDPDGTRLEFVEYTNR